MEDFAATKDPEKLLKLDWMKKKLNAIWSSPKFCGLCLENTGNFSPVDMELVFHKQNFSSSPREIINYVFNDEVKNVMSSHYLCDNCIERILQSYIFIHNTKQLSRIIKTCVNDIYSKVIDLNEQVSRTSDLDNANVMIVLENDVDLHKTLPTVTPTAIRVEQPEIVVVPKIETLEDPLAVISNVETLSESIAVVPKQEPLDDPINFEHEPTPNITLKDGHIVIKPLNSSRNLTPSYKTYECTSCPEIFTSYRSLQEHKIAKHLKLNVHNQKCYKDNEIKCTRCNMNVAASLYSQHTIRCPYQPKRHVCSICGRAFHLKTLFRLHQKVHMLRQKCPYCTKRLVPTSLKRHIIVIHGMKAGESIG